eukprot:m.164281 g.164281  ORF g.164281 m.164281 type:complete len:219 (-) comp9883_c0_seq1:77-733(-)
MALAPSSPASDTVEERDRYKLLVIGDYGVGKTAIIRRYVENSFDPKYKLTIGVDFSSKKLAFNGRNIELQLWDIAGHERFGHLTHVYYKYAIAAIIVFDLGRPATFDSVSKWHHDLNEKVMLPNGDPVPAILLANKSDMPSSDLDKERLDRYCKEKGFLAWYPTSAKNDTNITDAMNLLIEKILEVSHNLQHLPKPKDEFVQVKSAAAEESKESKCCE